MEKSTAFGTVYAARGALHASQRGGIFEREMTMEWSHNSLKSGRYDDGMEPQLLVIRVNDDGHQKVVEISTGYLLFTSELGASR